MILEVLADGVRRRSPEIAKAAKVTRIAAIRALAALVADGRITRQGKSRATTYGRA